LDESGSREDATLGPDAPMTKSLIHPLAVAALLLGLAACGPKTYSNGENGAQAAAVTPTENTVYHEPFSNGNVDASMEGSGNLAGQGNYAAPAPPSGR
jgi:hypothetical protein